MVVRGQFPFTVIGHRGCAGVEPENTLLGIRRAIEMGCPMVEIDVQLLEGKLVVLHDEVLDRTTNGDGPLGDYTVDQLRSLDAGKGEKVPFLEEVLVACRGHCHLNIELKAEGTAEAVTLLLESQPGADVVISSFYWNWLEEVRQLDEALDIAVLVHEAYQLDTSLLMAKKLRAVSVNPSVHILTKEFVDQVHAQGMLVYPYTVRSHEDLQKVLACGADGCFADNPQEVMEAL